MKYHLYTDLIRRLQASDSFQKFQIVIKEIDKILVKVGAVRLQNGLCSLLGR